MSNELETTGVGTATEPEVRDDGDVSAHTETAEPAEDTTGDDAALATLDKALGNTETTGDEGAETTQTTEQAGDKGEQPEAIEPELLAAASFTGLSEQDLRDAIGAVGKDKAVGMLKNLVAKASERWGIEASGQKPAEPDPAAAAAAAAQQQAQQQAQGQPPANPNDPLAAFDSPDFGKEFLEDFPEAKPFVEHTKNLAKVNRQQQQQVDFLASMLARVAQERELNAASDLYEFFQETDAEGKHYGPLAGQPTPEQVKARTQLHNAARIYQRQQQEQGIPMRFSRALKDTHAALTIGSANPGKAQQKAAAVEAQSKRRDVMPSSPGTAAPKSNSIAEADANARRMLKEKYGINS